MVDLNQGKCLGKILEMVNVVDVVYKELRIEY